MSRAWLRPLVLPARCALAACGALLLACSASPPTRYYTLSEINGRAPVPAASNPIAVRVEPVAIPPELDRLEIVSREGPNRVHIAESELWAAPLDEQIRRILSDDLAARLPPQLVVDPDEPATTQPRRLLSVTIAQFYGDASCAVTLRAGWTLRNPRAGSRRGTEEVQIPASAPCAGALPAAMSRALAALADRLAPVIAAD